jgi:predicted TIM-barrel fold metal-dependent hydrolase
MTALSISASRTEMPPSRPLKKRCVSTHPVVFHTGFHAWGGNRPERCHSEDLTGLVSSLPKTDFLLLHSGIPFLDEAITLAAYYPNVHLSMAWMHIIDRRKSVEAARRYIEALPLNKIHAFGGDYMFAENIAGHLEIALESLAEAFGDEVETGRMTAVEAVFFSLD